MWAQGCADGGQSVAYQDSAVSPLALGTGGFEWAFNNPPKESEEWNLVFVAQVSAVGQV